MRMPLTMNVSHSAFIFLFYISPAFPFVQCSPEDHYICLFCYLLEILLLKIPGREEAWRDTLTVRFCLYLLDCWYFYFFILFLFIFFWQQANDINDDGPDDTRDNAFNLHPLLFCFPQTSFHIAAVRHFSIFSTMVRIHTHPVSSEA
jgi:hypothetical protein